jgi:hypothetical protein
MGELLSVERWQQSLTTSLDRFWEAMGRMLPAIVGAVLIMLLGWAISWIVQVMARRFLHHVGLDRTAARLGLIDSLRQANVVMAPSAILARVLFWILMLTFLLAATETLGLRAVTTTIDRLVAYLPNVVGAALILVLGFVVGRAAQRLVGSGASMAGLPQADKLGVAAHGVVLMVAAVVAIEQLGLRTDFLVTVITVLVATLSLTMGLAFALGARSLVTHILAGHYLRQSLATGTMIEIGDRKGVVESIGAVNTTLRRDDRSWLVPNGRLLEEVVVQ